MTIETALARLTAGLDRDEAIARAAGADTVTWISTDGEVFAVHGALTGEHRCSEHEPGVPNHCDDLPIGPDTDFDLCGHVAAQMVRQQPRRTLGQVEAIRKVLAEVQDPDPFGDYVMSTCVDPSGFQQGVAMAAECFIAALAGIYTEPTEEITADSALADVPDAELHRRFAHPAYQYATTEGQRKCWDAVDEPPAGEGWERNVDAGRDGWERFDYTEESYWRRLRDRPEPTDTEGGTPDAAR